MLFEPGPEEPEEKNPEDRWGNPEEKLSIEPEPPSVSVPQTDDANADPELLRTFWASVVLANVALAGVTVGPMLIYFRGQWKLGGLLVVIGLFCFARTYSIYAEFRDRENDDREDDDREDDNSENDGGSPSRDGHDPDGGRTAPDEDGKNLDGG